LSLKISKEAANDFKFAAMLMQNVTLQTVKDLLALCSHNNDVTFQEEAKKALLKGIEMISET